MGSRLAPAVAPDDDAGEAGLEVLAARRERDDRHHLARGDDHPSLLAHDAVRDATESDHRIAKRPVVHVDGARPGDAARIGVERVALREMIVEHRRQEIVGRGDRVKVAGEVEVDVLHRDHLRVAAARCPSLHAEHRPHARLAHAEHGILAESTHCLRETHERRALSLAGRGRIDAGDEHEPSLRGALGHLEIYLRLVLAVEIQLVRPESEIGCDIDDGAKLRVLRDLDIGRNSSHTCLHCATGEISADDSYPKITELGVRRVARVNPNNRSVFSRQRSASASGATLRARRPGARSCAPPTRARCACRDAERGRDRVHRSPRAAGRPGCARRSSTSVHVLERDDPAERDVPSVPERALGERQGARVAVKDAGDAVARRAVDHDRGVGFGVARVHDHRQRALGRERELRLEGLVLDERAARCRSGSRARTRRSRRRRHRAALRARGCRWPR